MGVTRKESTATRGTEACREGGAGRAADGCHYHAHTRPQNNVMIEPLRLQCPRRGHLSVVMLKNGLIFQAGGGGMAQSLYFAHYSPVQIPMSVRFVCRPFLLMIFNIWVLMVKFSPGVSFLNLAFSRCLGKCRSICIIS